MVDLLNKLTISIPSRELLIGIRGMSAACTDSNGQAARLGWSLETLAGFVRSNTDCLETARILQTTDLPVSDNLQYLTATNITHWEKLFSLIQLPVHAPSFEHKIQQIKNIIDQLKINNDLLLKALLTCHDEQYVVQIIHHCCVAKLNETKADDKAKDKSRQYKVDDDVVITPHTFEFIIRDLIATIENRSKVNLSISLPSHHAHYGKAKGFCIINTVHVLTELDHLISQSRQFLQSEPSDVTKIIVGLDVNNDNGLRDSWWHDDSSRNIKHIDIFDSRVYPINCSPIQLERYFTDKI